MARRLGRNGLVFPLSILRIYTVYDLATSDIEVPYHMRPGRQSLSGQCMFGHMRPTTLFSVRRTGMLRNSRTREGQEGAIAGHLKGAI